ncbi:hypothetical protein HK105_209113 [Polyrhizophydium stewartii]|uniref:Ankyrin repeat protein n=1 Tax=Polyrhizophydium stewartii TaxID=2732419 RepID=A0ABR4MW02_9FUNG
MNAAAGPASAEEPPATPAAAWPGASHWDRLPAELHGAIICHAGPLLQVTTGWRAAETLTAAERTQLWREAVEAEWQGDLRTLPPVLPVSGELHAAIRSRAMFDRLKALGNERLNSELLLAAVRHRFDDQLDFGRPRRLVQAALEAGSASLLRELVDRRKVELGCDLAVTAARWGHLDVMRLLVERCVGQQWDHRVMDKAAEFGHLAVVRLLHEVRAEGCSAKALDLAAVGGHTEVVRYLHEHLGVGCTPWAAQGAAMFGHLGTIRLLHEMEAPCFSAAAMDSAAEYGHLPVVEFLHAERTEGCTSKAMDLAALNGHLGVVTFLSEARSEGCTTAAMDGAAQRGHVRVVRYLHFNRAEGCTTLALDSALLFGHTKVVEFLVEHRSEGCTSRGLERARQRGRFELVQRVLDRLPPDLVH